jgi:hypothetical protein
VKNFVLGEAEGAGCRMQPAGVDQPSLYSKTALRSPILVGHGRESMSSFDGGENDSATALCLSIGPCDRPTARSRGPWPARRSPHSYTKVGPHEVITPRRMTRTRSRRAEVKTMRRARMDSVGPSCVLASVVASPFKASRAAASASTVSDLPRWRRSWRLDRSPRPRQHLAP